MTCSCGQPATRTLCAVAYCHNCAETILTPIRQRVTAREPEREPSMGIGYQHGLLRPDHGDGWADLQCDVCGATWVGPLGEDCAYCLRWLELAQKVQREHLLRPELPDVDDERYEAAVEAWAERLGRGIAAELVTETQVTAAIQREAGKTMP